MGIGLQLGLEARLRKPSTKRRVNVLVTDPSRPVRHSQDDEGGMGRSGAAYPSERQRPRAKRFDRPCGTDISFWIYPALRTGLVSNVPAGRVLCAYNKSRNLPITLLLLARLTQPDGDCGDAGKTNSITFRQLAHGDCGLR
jgi:hypothetical protein